MRGNPRADAAGGTLVNVTTYCKAGLVADVSNERRSGTSQNPFAVDPSLTVQPRPRIV